MNTSSLKRWVDASRAVGFGSESQGIALDTTKVLATAGPQQPELDVPAGECSDEARSLHAGVWIATWPA
jgi:hypothetical protein